MHINNNGSKSSAVSSGSSVPVSVPWHNYTCRERGYMFWYHSTVVSPHDNTK